MQAKDRIILALDVDETEEAISLVRELAAYVGAFKVGMQLFNSVGPDIVRRIQDLGGRVFVDLKLHDIPNTVAGAARVIARMGCLMYTVHAAGGSAMIQAAADAVRDWQHESGQIDEAPGPAHQAPIMLAVTA